MSQKIECKIQAQFKILGTIIVVALVSTLVIMTIFSLWIPDAIGSAITNSIPFWWLIAIWGFFTSFTSPSLLIVGERGMEVTIWWWKRLLPWKAIDYVTTDKYQTHVYSQNLPWITTIAGIPFFRFKRRFTLHYRRTNYQLVVDMMKRNLGNKFESL